MIQPGLERIGLLLKNVQFPWKAIHVAGTNGKGSICAFASGLLTRRTIRNGRFTSPHLIDRWDCITVNDKPVSEQEFRKVEKHFVQLNQRESINASEFELLTATAFQLFTEKKVEVGVIEVGMGGKLDATNILSNQIISVISKIACDHQNFLGNTLEEIALHKAGILRPGVPYIVNPINEWNVHDVIDKYAEKIGAGPRVIPDTEELRAELYSSKEWREFATPLQPFQRDNAVLGYLAFLEALKSLNYSTSRTQRLLPAFTKSKGKLPGRFGHHRVAPVFGHTSRRQILIDGAHNPDAAAALNDYVHKNLRTKRQTKHGKDPLKGGWPITWVLAMTDGKDAQQYLARLLRPRDNVVTTTFGPVDGMPWVKPMDPKELLRIVKEVQPGVEGLYLSTAGAFEALCAAKYLAGHESPIVLTGSLYLVGDFLREQRQYRNDPKTMDMRAIDLREQDRVKSILSDRAEHVVEAGVGGKFSRKVKDRKEDEQSLREELEKLGENTQTLDAEESRLRRSRSLQFERPIAASKSKTAETTTRSTESRGKSISPKEKFSKDFENVRMQLLSLSSTSSNSSNPTPMDDGTHNSVRNVSKIANIESISRAESEPSIQTHFPPFNANEKSRYTLHQTSSDPELNTHIRKVAPLSEKDEQPLFKGMRPFGILRKIRIEDEEDLQDPTLGDQGPQRVYIRKHYSNGRAK